METKQSVKHTPGPWEIGTGWIFHKSDERMAGSGAPLREEVCRVLVTPIGDANARLIAAAPSLLEASEILNSELHEYMMKHEKVFDDSILDAILSLRAAIAKAEGGK